MCSCLVRLLLCLCHTPVSLVVLSVSLFLPPLFSRFLCHVFMYFLFHFDSFSSRDQCIWFCFPCVSSSLITLMYILHPFSVRLLILPCVFVFPWLFQAVLMYSLCFRFFVCLVLASQVKVLNVLQGVGVTFLL